MAATADAQALAAVSAGVVARRGHMVPTGRGSTTLPRAGMGFAMSRNTLSCPESDCKSRPQRSGAAEICSRNTGSWDKRS